jgi:HEAT repeat protein
MPSLDRFCAAMGPVLVAPLAAALAAEESRLAVRRVKDVLIGFGDAVRAPARALRDSTNPAVRRAAIELLRALGGEDALADLRTLLEDADPHVQREALRAIAHIGSDEAYAMLEEAFQAGEPRTREAIVHTIGSLHDERAAPLLAHILRQSDYHGAAEAAYLATIEALGRSGAHPEGIAVLCEALHRGEWWAPRRTSRVRAAAAMALQATASTAGTAALQDASVNGSRGVRAAATRAMSMPRRTSPAGGTE